MLKEVLQTNANSAWLISAHAANDLIDKYGAMITNPMAFAQMKEKPTPSAADDDYITQSFAAVALASSGFNVVGTYQLRYGQVPANSIAIIKMDGVLMKYDSCGSYGTQSLSNFVNAARENTNIIGAVIETDSPGGNVAGVRMLADSVNEFKKVKPIVSFINDGVCASGAYWIASQCHEIISSHETNIVGSIGVMLSLRDTRKRDQALGIEDIVIYADGSEGKHSETRAALDGDTNPIKLKMLNPIREAFKQAVKTGRAGKLQTKPSNPLSGEIYGDKTSISLGLVDSIGDLLAAVEAVSRRASSFPNSNKPHKSNSPKSSDDMKMKLVIGKHDSLIAAMGLKPADGQTEFEAETADVLAAQQKATSEAITKVTTSVEALTTAVGSVKTSSEKTSTDIQSMQTQIDALGESAGIIKKSKAENPDSPSGDERPKGKLWASR